MPRKTFVCQQCGKRFQNPKSAYRNPQFCTMDCYRVFQKSKYITITCLNCGEKFILPPNEARGRKFCSPICANRYNQSIDPSKRSIFICDWCNKEFEERTYRQSRFCSSKCRSKFGARQPKPNARKPEIHIRLKCKICGKLYKTTTHQVRLRGSSHCSVECRAQAQSLSMRGDGNPNWKGGFDPYLYGPNWGSQSRKARKRDNGMCQICDYKSGGDRALDVHHIKPLVEFNGDWESANQLDNLISLCRPCHQMVECGKMPCPKSRSRP